jgi:hypothetical protein
VPAFSTSSDAAVAAGGNSDREMVLAAAPAAGDPWRLYVAAGCNPAWTPTSLEIATAVRPAQGSSVEDFGHFIEAFFGGHRVRVNARDHHAPPP